MGEPVKIVDLARSMIEFSGLRENEDIKIVFTGLRPGEKMHEELVACGEKVSQTDVSKVMVHNPSSAEIIERTLIDREIEEIQALAYAQDEQKTVAKLWQIVKNHDSPPCFEGTDQAENEKANPESQG